MDVSTFWAKNSIARVRALRDKEWKMAFNQVLRERNNSADCLAHQAPREGTLLRIWINPPSNVIVSLYLDALT